MTSGRQTYKLPTCIVKDTATVGLEMLLTTKINNNRKFFRIAWDMLYRRRFNIYYLLLIPILTL